jgi:hypothetical protein
VILCKSAFTYTLIHLHFNSFKVKKEIKSNQKAINQNIEAYFFAYDFLINGPVLYELRVLIDDVWKGFTYIEELNF